GNERSTLALLHLLDPVSYPLHDLDGTRRKIERRREIGRALIALDPNAASVFIGRAVRQLLDLCPGDERVTSLGNELRTEPDAANRARIVQELHSHVANTYRLHRRLIRNR